MEALVAKSLVQGRAKPQPKQTRVPNVARQEMTANVGEISEIEILF